MEMTKAQYMEYLDLVLAKLAENRDYVTELDSATGDGDHWVNMNMGFQKLVSSREALVDLSLKDMFKKIGMMIMSTVGGSAGVLYGSAYIKASQVIGEKETIDIALLKDILDAQLRAIMERGNAQPGFKTMIDPLHVGVTRLAAALEEGRSDSDALQELKLGAIEGMEATRDMEAVKGRATYQTNKGVGCLDPGAVTMSYQIEVLVDYLTGKVLSQ
ncbi:MAG TPA: dihydroxyacetone kinase subunit DhaL [Clostridiaceae bacterium]|nr:dihydroxyacetone kinase subunit DhaL [Clostridiaceae bacterium]